MRRSSLLCAGARPPLPSLPRGGAGSSAELAAFLGYAIVVWAMTRAPIAVIAALRETSVLFAALIGVTLLGEPFRPQRAAAALVIVLGVVALRLG